MIIVIVAMAVSWLLCFFLIAFKHIHESFSADFTDSGPQKMHANATPRIGGIPLYIGLLAGTGVMVPGEWQHLCLPLMISLFPVWASGTLEDMSKCVAPRLRLMMAFLAALAGFYLLDARVTRVSISVIDEMLAHYWVISAIVTMVSVGGMTHAMNLIDGFNGLAGGIALMMLSVLAYVSHQVGDVMLVGFCLSLIGSTIGFMCWNYPGGRIFAGDGGAYLWGVLIAEIAVILVCRHPQVSPWFPFLLVIYPLWETLFTIYRRKVVRGLSVILPDAVHLHTLIYKRLVRYQVGSGQAIYKTRRNAMTSPYLWILASFSVVPAFFFWRDTRSLVLFSVLFIIVYCYLYAVIVRFQVPSWLVIHQTPTPVVSSSLSGNRLR